MDESKKGECEDEIGLDCASEMRGWKEARAVEER